VNKRGALTGGYHDQRSSRLSYMKSMKELSSKIQEARDEGQAVKSTNQQVKNSDKF
jgi:hypothetical protein